MSSRSLISAKLIGGVPIRSGAARVGAMGGGPTLMITAIALLEPQRLLDLPQQQQMLRLPLLA
jgi:hypothetical protein